MRLGIDAGGKFIKAVLAGGDGAIIHDLFVEHHGDPVRETKELLGAGPWSACGPPAVTGRFGQTMQTLLPGSRYVDEIQASVLAARVHGTRCDFIVNVGAGSIRCIELDAKGNFRAYRENGLCAAGTGSFLDEQMRRMGYGYGDLAGMPVTDNPPDIATRCAVFAKSDLIHRQQEGYSREALWSGLCRGVVHTMLSTLFKGGVPRASILFCGGIFLNRAVRHWTLDAAPGALFHERGHYLPALGALLHHNGGRHGRVRPSSDIPAGGCPDEQDMHRASGAPTGMPGESATTGERELRVLRCASSVPPQGDVRREFFHGDTEIGFFREPRCGQRVSLGVDVGSTSTKAVLVDAEDGGVLCDLYRKTAGDPVGAARDLFAAMREVLTDMPVITAAGTTGSGRRLIGEIMGAGLIVNEITAHFHGAARFDRGIETIFEIGGQDAKYIRAVGGTVVDSAMNYVCAAGTGSFIEEQANRLGFDVREAGSLALGRRIPHTSDRCTVFMEQDIHKLLGEGHSREEVLAGVMYAVAKNYLHRVVGSRPVDGDRVFFQGATARNRALVAAFEMLLDREIVVSPCCHVMGAYGAALLALERKSDRSDVRFRGIGAFDGDIRLEYRRCGDCSNHCNITVARIGDEEITWGHLCGREGNTKRTVRRGKNHFDGMGFDGVDSERAKSPEGANIYARLRENPDRGTIGIPLHLSMFHYLPLWETFLRELGFTVVRSGKSRKRHRDRAVELALADFCFPLKMGMAHAELLASEPGVDALFYPTLVSETPQKNGMPRVFCPYVIAFPSLMKQAVELPVPVIAPALDFRLDRNLLVRELASVFADYGVCAEEAGRAFDRGMEHLRRYRRERYREGAGVISRLKETGGTGLVLVGRPYNLYDPVVNLGLVERFRNFGVEVFPYEYLLDPDDDGDCVPHMYWHYGEKILRAAELIRETPDLYPVYFSNFGCGPDSFVLSRFEKTMRGKPYLILELDEHGADTGYLTRIEAFMDVVTAPGRETPRGGRGHEKFQGKWHRRERTLWIPPMHEISARLSAAGFRAWGFDARALPTEDALSLETGRQGVRGSECLPAHTTIGVFLRTMKKIGADPARQAFFMPTAEGPCRYGQYTVLHRQILDRHGYGATAIFSPSSVNSYMGMPESLRMYLWDILLAGDMVMKAVCRTRPYETRPGETDRLALDAVGVLEREIEERADLVPATLRAVTKIMAAPVSDTPRPLVGIVGEIYVRCNPFCNNNLIRAVEAQGGEAWLAPVSEWILYTSWCERYFAHLYRRGRLHNFILDLKTRYIFGRARKFEHALRPHLEDRFEPEVERVLELGRRYVPVIFEGEAILTVGRALAFADDGAALVVNCAPFGCMPGNVTGAFFQGINRESAVPVVTLFYDGESDINRIAGIYLNNLETGDLPPSAIDAAGMAVEKHSG